MSAWSSPDPALKRDDSEKGGKEGHPSAADRFVAWFRGSSPYIHAHRGRTFVIVFAGEAVADPRLPELIHDIALLHGLGIRLVLVYGARPQIEERLRLRSADMRYINGLRVTDGAALACVKDAAGGVRVELEALLSMGLANSPMAGARIRVASGNLVAARPLGVVDGVDYGHTGRVRRVDAEAMRALLGAGAIVLVPPLGYSPTGEVFNLSATETGAFVAITLNADKLIYLMERTLPLNREGEAYTNLLPAEIDSLLRMVTDEELRGYLSHAADACRSGVQRVHLLDRRSDGVLLRELFTRDGSGTLITAKPYEDTRAARLDDVGGILELLEPLESLGILVRRSRELLETEINRFTVIERDGMIIGCAALYDYPADGMAELACVAVHPEYRSHGRGDMLLHDMERRALALGVGELFVLTTQTAHWFRERGFEPSPVESLPMQRRQLYNYQRNSKVFSKRLVPLPRPEGR